MEVIASEGLTGVTMAKVAEQAGLSRGIGNFHFQSKEQLLLETLSTLSERDREIIHLRFFGRLTNRKIAEIMELKEKTVSVIILRALQKLKVQIEDQEAI